MRINPAIIVIALAAVLAGCSGAGVNGIAPEENPVPSIDNGRYINESHYALGMWQFKASADEGTLEVTPLRISEMHLNAMLFLEPPPLLNITLESPPKFTGDILDVDIGLRHPFLGLLEFTGFDVCGILISMGSVGGYDDSNVLMPGSGDTRLLNADGYSRWWNPSEFPHNNTMFAYKDGLLGTPDASAHYNATVNGYKLFCDLLGASTEVGSLSPAQRCVFSAGQKNIRHYKIQLGSDGLVFNYAVDANWVYPMGQAPWQVPDDFPPAANRPESWNIAITEAKNTLWNDGVDYGGELKLAIDVWDHFDADLNTVKVESPGHFTAVSSGTATGGGEGYSTYEIDITTVTPPVDMMDLFISVISEKKDYQGFIPGADITAYFTHSVTVDDQNPGPKPGIYVDGDNAGDPLMDGSYYHPFDKIQSGINLALSGEEVNVDAISGGGVYNEAITLKSGVSLLGNNWNGGVGKPKVTSSTSGQVFYGNDVSDTLIEGLEIIVPTGPPIKDYTSNSNLNGIHFKDTKSGSAGGGSTNNNTIRKCRFTGTVTTSVVYRGIYLDAAIGTLIELCECCNITGQDSSSPDFINFLFVYYSDNTTIRKNWVHDISASKASGSSNRIRIFHLLWSDNLVVKNNLVNKLTCLNGYCNVEGTYVDGQGGEAHSNNPVIMNNTFDDVYVAAPNYGCLNIVLFSSNPSGTYNIPNTKLVNNIVSNTYGISPSSWAYQFVNNDPANPCTAYYCNAFNTMYLNASNGEGYINIVKGTGCYGNYTNPQNPDYKNTPSDYDIKTTSTSQYGDPSIVDWDDTGAPSNDPSNHDINKRSRMGAFGGPDGGWWPLE